MHFAWIMVPSDLGIVPFTCRYILIHMSCFYKKKKDDLPTFKLKEILLFEIKCTCDHWLTLVAQLDAHPTSDQEVVGSTPAGSATYFHRD